MRNPLEVVKSSQKVWKVVVIHDEHVQVRKRKRVVISEDNVHNAVKTMYIKFKVCQLAQ